MKNHARLRQIITVFTRLIETCGGDKLIPLIPNFRDRCAFVRATLQKTT